jgi:Transposase DDE domain
VPVRVIDYCLDGVADAEPIYRLVTTIFNHEKAPAAQLAALYHERWEIETALDELKTHLRGAGIVLRSKTPNLVRQEFYGLMMAHFAIRGLMHEAALKADDDPDRLSFLHAVRVVRRKLPRLPAIPPLYGALSQEPCNALLFAAFPHVDDSAICSPLDNVL